MIFKEMSREEIDFHVKQHSVVRVRCTPQIDVAGGDGRVGCRPDQLLVCDLQMQQRCGHMMNWQKIKRGIADGDFCSRGQCRVIASNQKSPQERFGTS